MERSIEGLEFRLNILNYQITGTMTADYHEDESAAPNWARIILPDEVLENVSGKEIGECSLEIGTEGDFEVLLEGSGEIQDNPGEVLIIRDGLEKLRKVRICNTFLNCRPQEAVRYILVVSGIDSYHLTDTAIDSKDMFSITDMTALDALAEINTIFGISVSYRFKDGEFWWGEAQEQEDVVTITDDNVMRLQRSEEIWEADILAIPWIRTGDLISVDCAEYTGLGRVTRRVLKNSDRGIDMYINFKEVSNE